MHGIRLTKGREERPVIASVGAKQCVSAYFVAVYAKRGSQRDYPPACREEHRCSLQEVVLQWDLGAGENHLRNENEWQQAGCTILISCKGRGCQSYHHTYQSRQC